MHPSAWWNPTLRPEIYRSLEIHGENCPTRELSPCTVSIGCLRCENMNHLAFGPQSSCQCQWPHVWCQPSQMSLTHGWVGQNMGEEGGHLSGWFQGCWVFPATNPFSQETSTNIENSAITDLSSGNRLFQSTNILRGLHMNYLMSITHLHVHGLRDVSVIMVLKKHWEKPFTLTKMEAMAGKKNRSDVKAGALVCFLLFPPFLPPFLSSFLARLAGTISLEMWSIQQPKCFSPHPWGEFCSQPTTSAAFIHSKIRGPRLMLNIKNTLMLNVQLFQHLRTFNI